MQGLEKSREPFPLIRIRRRKVGGFSLDPRRHAPCPRVFKLGNADANRRGNGEGQAFFEMRQPALLIEDQLRRELPAREAQRERVSEPQQLIIPTGSNRDDGQAGEIGMLSCEQLTSLAYIDSYFSCGCAHRAIIWSAVAKCGSVAIST